MRAGEALVRMLKGEAKPVTSWGNLPMIPHVMRQSTLAPYPGKPFKTPNKAIQERAREMEREAGVLCASVFVGFPVRRRGAPPPADRARRARAPAAADISTTHRRRARSTPTSRRPE